MAISLTGGVVTGFILKTYKAFVKGMYAPPPGEDVLDRSQHFTDDRYWNVSASSIEEVTKELQKQGLSPSQIKEMLAKQGI